jgi:hypothetical protein
MLVAVFNTDLDTLEFATLVGGERNDYFRLTASPRGSNNLSVGATSSISARQATPATRARVRSCPRSWRRERQHRRRAKRLRSQLFERRAPRPTRIIFGLELRAFDFGDALQPLSFLGLNTGIQLHRQLPAP